MASVRPYFTPESLRWLLLVLLWRTVLSSALVSLPPSSNSLSTSVPLPTHQPSKGRFCWNRGATMELPGCHACDSSWAAAKKELRDPKCCVVSVYAQVNSTTDDTADNHNENQHKSLGAHLAVLRDQLGVRGPSDVDIRVWIDTTTIHLATEDCLTVCQSVLSKDKKVTGADTIDGKADIEDNVSCLIPSARALAELATGMASFAGDCRCPGDGVFLRLVCASSYQAHDPVFHTDKAPLRGYVTLAGAGTEFVAHPCSVLEYVVLRSLGVPLPQFVVEPPHKNGDGWPALRRASEREFIVMKGDHYYRKKTASASSWWQRAFACVHRSPPGIGGGSRRVIVSFDLADGDDNREWHDAQRKRKWRAGMTQRKSRLVA